MTNTVPTFTPPCFTVAGVCQVWVNTGAAYAMQLLGITARGVTIQETTFQRDLKTDRYGGDAGPPADFLHLGRMDTIDFELAEYNEAVLSLLEVRVNAGSAAVIAPGTLIGCAGGYFRVLLIAPNFARNYTRVFINDPITRAPIGLAEMTPRLSLTGLMDPSAVAGSIGAPVNQSPWNTNYTVSGSSVT